MRRDVTSFVNRTERCQRFARFVQSPNGRLIEPLQLCRIVLAPQPTVEQQGRKVALEYLWRIERWKASISRFFPKTVSQPRRLPCSTTGALCGGRKAGTFGYQPGDACCLIKPCTASKTAVDHDPDTVDGEAGFGDVGGENNFAETLAVTCDGVPLGGGIDLSMKFVDYDAITQIAEGICGATNLPDTWQEYQDVPIRLGQSLTNHPGNICLDRLLRHSPDITQREWPAFALAFNHQRIFHKRREAGAIKRCRHCQQPQIGPECRLCLQCQRQAEVAIETSLMYLVKKHSRHASEFRISNNSAAKYALGQHQNARLCRLLAVHSSRIAYGLSDLDAHHVSDPLSCHSRCQSPWREKQYLSAAPRLTE